MTMKDFIDLLDRFGAEASAWPPAARAAAQRLLADSAEARQALADQSQLDLLMAMTGRAPPLDWSALAARASRGAQIAPAPAWRRRTQWAAEAAVAVLTLSLGLATGWASHRPEDPAQAVADALALPEAMTLPDEASNAT